MPKPKVPNCGNLFPFADVTGQGWRCSTHMFLCQDSLHETPHGGAEASVDFNLIHVFINRAWHNVMHLGKHTAMKLRLTLSTTAVLARPAVRLYQLVELN